jgi:hypothetical protein
VTPDTVVQLFAPDGLDQMLYPVAASCVLSIAGAVQVTVNALPGPCVIRGAAGGYAIWGVDVAAGFGVLAPKACIVAVCRMAGRGVGRYIGIFRYGSCGVEKRMW